MYTKILFFLAFMLIAGVLYAQQDSYFYDSMFKFGVNIPSSWGQIYIESFNPGLYGESMPEKRPQGIDPTQPKVTFDECWETIRRTGGIRGVWARRFPDNTIGIILVRAAEVKHIIETEGEQIEMLNLDDVHEGELAWAKKRAAQIKTERETTLCGKEAWLMEYLAPGFGFAINIDGKVPTRVLTTILPVIDQGRDYAFSVEMRCPNQYFDSVKTDYDGVIASFKWGEPTASPSSVSFEQIYPVIATPETQENTSDSSVQPEQQIESQAQDHTTEQPINGFENGDVSLPPIGIGSPFESSNITFILDNGKFLKFSVTDVESLKSAIRRMIGEDEPIKSFLLRIWMPFEETDSLVPNDWKDLNVDIGELYTVIPLSAKNLASLDQLIDLIDSLELPDSAFVDVVEIRL